MTFAARSVLNTQSMVEVGAVETSGVSRLKNDDASEVLSFLSVRPVETVFMAGLIYDNGIVSEHHRGSFFAYRNDRGELEGLCLNGHATLFEARTELALTTLARTVNSPSACLLRGNETELSLFWKEYESHGKPARLICDELLLERTITRNSKSSFAKLRRATLEDLEQILTINSQLFFTESGRDPLVANPKGFRQRTARRISQGHIWVWSRDGEIIFKTEVLAATPQVTYLESLYVAPAQRWKGYGSDCLTELGSILSHHTNQLCLTVNRSADGLIAFYRKAGYRIHSNYQTIYLQ